MFFLNSDARCWRRLVRQNWKLQESLRAWNTATNICGLGSGESRRKYAGVARDRRKLGRLAASLGMAEEAAELPIAPDPEQRGRIPPMPDWLKRKRHS